MFTDAANGNILACTHLVVGPRRQEAEAHEDEVEQGDDCDGERQRQRDQRVRHFPEGDETPRVDQRRDVHDVQHLRSPSGSVETFLIPTPRGNDDICYGGLLADGKTQFVKPGQSYRYIVSSDSWSVRKGSDKTT